VIGGPALGGWARRRIESPRRDRLPRTSAAVAGPKWDAARHRERERCAADGQQRLGNYLWGGAARVASLGGSAVV